MCLGVGAGVGASVEMALTSAPMDGAGPHAGVAVRLLGPLEVERDGRSLELPRSRKARALFAYLCLAPHAVTRADLCDLLWETANDPRAELRWCLSRLRAALGDGARLVTHDDAIRLDLVADRVDALALDAALRDARPADLALDRCRTLAALFRGDVARGLELDEHPRFSAWLTAQRHRYGALHADLLERLATALPDEDAQPFREQWRQRSPFDPRMHRCLMSALVRAGRVQEAEQQLDAAAKLFEDEGLDAAPLHAAWQAARALAPSRSSARLVIVEADARREPAATALHRRASIAVMPFADAAGPVPGATGDALAHDVITRLAKLRALLVIAPATVFELRSRGLAPAEAARLLDVDYVAGGSLRHDGGHLRVDAELIDARSGHVVWADALTQRRADALAMLDDLGDRIVASIASEVEMLERNRAVLKPPNSLDAWESYHRGLWHMYRFNEADNASAQHFFVSAAESDPTFSRAWAGLSFTHWQSAFQGWAERGPAVDRAFDAAGQSLLADERDPAAHWAMGRALWLRSQHDSCVRELEQAVDLSPNFALAHYTLAFVQSQAGDAAVAIEASEVSRRLSPFDPLLFGMLGARAMALVRLGRYDEAGAVAMQAAARPNAHTHIQAIAAFSLALAGALDQAQPYVAAIRRTAPRYTVADFFGAFRFDAQGIAAFRRGARRLGMG